MDSVQVAVRIRPLSNDELDRGCCSCIETFPELQQVRIISKSFTFNHVFDHYVSQSDLYLKAVKNLVEQLFKGYNVTVLAYGQTGSGKTYSMGTNYPCNTEQGIIPRAIDDIFQKVLTDQEWDYKIRVSFVELYNEQLYDLLSDKPRDQCIVDLRDDGKGAIYLPGLTEVDVGTKSQTLQCLQKGSVGRATGATAMNAQSSRSHAIFTIYIFQSKKDNETEAMSAKFHLVDLAGSERSKKTKTIGKIFKEGVHINKELFILGNVISALGEGNDFVNYRDSKITRLLQDSLGGNAYTIMIACVSPSDDNHFETLSTLKYADRARKIKNKPIVNQDPKSAEIARLKKENQELKLELLARSGTRGRNNGNVSSPNHDVFAQKVEALADTLSECLVQIASMSERALMAEKARHIMQEKLNELTLEFSCIEETVKTALNESQFSKFQDLKSCIYTLQDVQKKSNDELKTQERSFSTNTIENSLRKFRKSVERTTDGNFEPQEQFLLEQTNLNQQLQELTKELAWKEHLVSNMVSTSSEMISMQSISEKDLLELQQKVFKLQKEKEELVNQMKKLAASVDLTKLTELEEEITVLTEEIKERERIIKMKKNMDQKLIDINQDILNMKQTKLRLINQLKFEAEKCKIWKAERKHAIFELSQQVEHQTQIAGIENKNLKEKNFEEAVGIHKRLKDALSLQQAAQGKRQLMGNPELISQWINQELEIMLSTMEAERILKQLIKDRATVTKTLRTLKMNSNDSALHNEERMTIQEEINKLNQNLDLMSTLILDLKQNIEESDQENKAWTRWECIQSIVDAKYALRCLFEAFANAKRESASKDTTLHEIHDLHKDALNTVEIKEEQIIEQQKAIRNLEEEYEEKVFLLLRQFKKNGIVSNNEMLSIEEDELRKMHELRCNLDHWRKKCEELEKVVSEKKTSIEKVPFPNNTNMPPEGSKQTEFPIPGHTTSEDDDDDENAPEWTKTLLYKRLQALKHHKIVSYTKGSVNGVQKCLCHSNCTKEICNGSRENVDLKCSVDCKCISGDNENEKAVNDDSNSGSSNQ